jgi:hypothetical protein
MKHALAATAVLAAALLTAAPVPAAAPSPEETAPAPLGIRVGGPCTYADYPGVAAILAVTPAAPDKNRPTPPYPGMTVTYTFSASSALPPQGIHLEGKVQTLTLVNGWAPGRRFLEKYGIRPGASLPCVLRIIKSGTCTPMIFDFPGIDLADYFEIEK